MPDAETVEKILAEDPKITHVSMVHSETTSGILNDIESVAKAVKAAGKVFIVDAMSSFGGVEIPVKEWGIDFIISSANKCIQGVPGFSFIICRLDELKKRYMENERLLVSEMKKLGYQTYIDEAHPGPIITTFLYPDQCNYTFKEMYEFIKARGYAIYPGKVTEKDTFRIGNIGEIYREDIEKLIFIYKDFLNSEKMSIAIRPEKERGSRYESSKAC